MQYILIESAVSFVLSLNRFVQTHPLTAVINNQSVLSMLQSIVYKVHHSLNFEQLFLVDLNRQFVQRSVNGILRCVLG